jgi:hypothetical protein
MTSNERPKSGILCARASSSASCRPATSRESAAISGLRSAARARISCVRSLGSRAAPASPVGKRQRGVRRATEQRVHLGRERRVLPVETLALALCQIAGAPRGEQFLHRSRPRAHARGRLALGERQQIEALLLDFDHHRMESEVDVARPDARLHPELRRFEPQAGGARLLEGAPARRRELRRNGDHRPRLVRDPERRPVPRRHLRTAEEVREREDGVRRARLLRNALERGAPLPVPRAQIGVGVERDAQAVLERRCVGQRRRLCVELAGDRVGAIALLALAARMDGAGRREEKRSRRGEASHAGPPSDGRSSVVTSTVPRFMTNRHFQVA